MPTRPFWFRFDYFREQQFSFSAHSILLLTWMLLLKRLFGSGGWFPALPAGIILLLTVQMLAQVLT
jgi:hypothetical protein